jgi:hypothetical protein
VHVETRSKSSKEGVEETLDVGVAKMSGKTVSLGAGEGEGCARFFFFLLLVSIGDVDLTHVTLRRMCLCFL